MKLHPQSQIFGYATVAAIFDQKQEFKTNEIVIKLSTWVEPSVSEIRTSLMYFIDFGLGSFYRTQLVQAQFESCQKWHKNNHLSLFIKDMSKSEIHSEEKGQFESCFTLKIAFVTTFQKFLVPQNLWESLFEKYQKKDLKSFCWCQFTSQ